MTNIEEELNINEEYEKMVPPTERKSLFDESEGYEDLREYIMAQPYNSLRKKTLPFAGINLMGYVDFKRNEAIDKARAEHKHLFFIQQLKKGDPDFCDAVGYYDKNNDDFYVLPYSYIVSDAIGLVPLPSVRKSAKNLDGKNRYIFNRLHFVSPEEAATFVLGQKAGLDEWVDSRGKSLLYYYPKLERLKDNKITKVAAPQIEESETSKKARIVFYIKEDGVCNASGYLDAEKGHFYILRGSLIALNADDDFKKSAAGSARSRLLNSACNTSRHYHIVMKDAKCRSASAAASYVLGRSASYIEWETKDGKALKDYYPERFHRKKQKQNDHIFGVVDMEQLARPVQLPLGAKRGIHLFYIKRNEANGRVCSATGYYDTSSNRFILKEGSTWSTILEKEFQKSISYAIRTKLIILNCKWSKEEIKQVRDAICPSPSVAAACVLGYEVDGLEEWKDKDGNTLKRFKEASGITDAHCI